MLGEIFEIQITDLSRGGKGVARLPDGKVIFVAKTAPGDRVRIQLIAAEKRYCEGELLDILEPSPIRVQAPCPYFLKCGGCEWQHLPYPFQWQTKVSGIRHNLNRLGIDITCDILEFPAESPWEYRNRIQLRGIPGAIGFFEKTSRTLVPIERCAITRPEINRRLPAIQTESQQKDREFKIEIEVTPTGEVREAWNRGHAAFGFRQVNDAQNRCLQEFLKTTLLPGHILLDLFGGIGNFSLPLTSLFEVIHCVDSMQVNPPVVPPHFHFHRSDANRWLRHYLHSNRPTQKTLHSLVLDPPREGLSENFAQPLRELSKINVQQMVLIGCDPDAWARDIKLILNNNFELSKIALFDFFPQTHHVESVAVFTSKRGVSF